MNEIPVAGRTLRAVRPTAPVAADRAEVGIPPDEQLAYARLLDIGMRLGLLLLVLTFAVYLLGAAEPHIPFADLPKYWSLPVAKYLAATGTHAGWGWIHLLHKGDYLNFVGIAFLSGITILCYLATAAIFVQKKDAAYAWLSTLEVLVLGLAASGVLTVGGH